MLPPIYKLASIAAPPKSAAAPTIPVFIGIAAPPELELDLAVAVTVIRAVAVISPAGTVVIGAGMPEVYGTLVAELAPEKATVALVSVTFAEALALEGFRTLERLVLARFSSCSRESNKETYPSITCMTPFAIRTSGLTTLAELTNTVPFATVMVKF